MKNQYFHSFTISILCLVFGTNSFSLSHQVTPSETCIIKYFEAPAGVCEVTEGLKVIGTFDENRPTTIFTHEWIPSYELGVPDFVNAEGWHEAGFNTLIFYFIRDSFDIGDGETCRISPAKAPIIGRIKTSCPKAAEQRVWKQGGISDRFVAAYKDFFADKVDYKKELRLVGHSLSAQIVTAAAYSIYLQQDIKVKPARVDLLDPYIGDNSFGTGDLNETLTKAYPSQILKGSECKPNQKPNTYCAVENALLSLKASDVAITIYGSASAAFFARNLRKNFHYQEFHQDWLCRKSTFADRPRCLLPTYSNVTAKHFFPLFSYFWSINEDIPKDGLSAKTPTKLLVGGKSYRKQKPGTDWCNLPKGIPFWKEGGVDHVFGIGRYDGEIGRGYQDSVDSQVDLAERLTDYLGFDYGQAEQCAAALSLANDVYVAE